MKKILSMILFLAAAGIGFTLLPSCGGGAGKDESAAGVITVNDVKRGKKALRVYMSGTWMQIKPTPSGDSTDIPEGDHDNIASVPCEIYIDTPKAKGYYEGQIVNYRVAHVNDQGIPDSASFSLAISPEDYIDFSNPANLPWQLLLHVGTSGSSDSWAMLYSSIEISIDSFSERTGHIVYTIETLNNELEDYDKEVPIEVYSNR